MDRLTIIYDANCRFCTRCRWWLFRQSTYLALEFLPQGSPTLRDRYPELRLPEGKAELVVIDDEGAVYREDEAFLMCLYALRDYRAWSLRLADPALRPLARAFFGQVSLRRHTFSRLLGPTPTEWQVPAEVEDACGCGPDLEDKSEGSTCTKSR